MIRRPLLAAAVLLVLLGGVACGPPIDLSKALQVTDVVSGWYDAGLVDGKNKLVPSISFKLHNATSARINTVQLTVSFWIEGADGELDSALVLGVDSSGLAPGASTQPILVRATAGYTLEQPRSELFSHSQFKDATAKLFGKQAGPFYPLGQFKVDRIILPHVFSGAPRP